jgi:hypothetical protein
MSPESWIGVGLIWIMVVGFLMNYTHVTERGWGFHPIAMFVQRHFLVLFSLAIIPMFYGIWKMKEDLK